MVSRWFWMNLKNDPKIWISIKIVSRFRWDELLKFLEGVYQKLSMKDAEVAMRDSALRVQLRVRGSAMAKLLLYVTKWLLLKLLSLL